MRKIRPRRIYKRDKDGQFARVNTLLNGSAIKRKVKSKVNRPKTLPSKSSSRNQSNDRDIEPQILDAAAGKLSLAEGPAREIAAKHDLSGHNRSEANKAAYRECAKYARELKAKYGADAPTADRIYSAAKFIQRGGDLGAKIREEEGDGVAKPDPPKPERGKGKPTGGSNGGLKYADESDLNRRRARVKDRIKLGLANEDDLKELSDVEAELKRRREARKINAGTKIDGKDLKVGDVIKVNNGRMEYVVIANDGKTIVAEKLGQQKITHVRWDVGSEFTKLGERKPRQMYGSGPGAPRSPKSTLVPLNKIESLGTADLIDQYNMADQAGSKRFLDRALIELKARARSGDSEAAAWFESNKDKPGAPRLPKVSIVELNKRIGRALRMLRSSPTTEEKEIYQKRIDNFNSAISDRLENSTLEELQDELKEAQRELVNARRDLKTYKLRFKQYPDSDSYKSMAQNAENEVAVNLGAVNKIKERINQLKGKAEAAEGDTADDDDPKVIKRNDELDPPPARLNRESSVLNLLDGAISFFTSDIERKSSLEQPWNEGFEIGTWSGWNERFNKDPEFQEEMLGKFLDILKDPSAIRNRDGYLYREFTDRNGYNDLSAEDRNKLAESDFALIKNWLNPEVQLVRMDFAFKDWLETSDSAYDLAANYNYDTDSLFEIFMDGNEQFAYRNDYMDVSDIVAKYRKQYRSNKFDAASLAKQPRPERPPSDPKDIKPVPYRAKNDSVSELRREIASLDKEVVYDVNDLFGNRWAQLTPEQQQAARDKVNQDMDRRSKLKERAAAAKPDRSRSISEAKDFDELHDIFANRNPNIKSLLGWHEPDGDLAKKMELGGVYGEAHKQIVLKRCIKAFEAAEKMADEYPEVPFDGLNVKTEKAFSQNAIAHCSRGRDINVEFNADYFINKSPAPGGDPTGFHPPNFSDNPFFNVMVHEFGHSLDWFAFGLHDIAADLSLLDRNEGRGVARNKIWETAMDEVFRKRDRELASIMVNLYRDLQSAGRIPRNMSFDSFYNKNTSEYARTNYHELIAESWQDYDANGRMASPISIAISQFVINTYKKRVQEGKADPYVIKATN